MTAQRATLVVALFLWGFSDGRCEESQEERIRKLEQRIESLQAELSQLKPELSSLREVKKAESVHTAILTPSSSTSLKGNGFLHISGDPLDLDSRPFTFGSFEYDLTASLSGNVSTSGALVFMADATTLGVGFVIAADMRRHVEELRTSVSQPPEFGSLVQDMAEAEVLLGTFTTPPLNHVDPIHTVTEGKEPK